MAPGESVTVSGDGCSPGAEVTIEFRQDGVTKLLATVTADDSGAFSAVVTIPVNAQPGPALLVATCNGHVTVLPLEVVPGGGALPVTGSSGSTGTLVGVGGALVALGAAAVYGARRRTASPASAAA